MLIYFTRWLDSNVFHVMICLSCATLYKKWFKSKVLLLLSRVPPTLGTTWRLNLGVLQLAEQLSPLDVFLALMAAAAHDVDHPGVNQPFLIKTRHHLASLYQVNPAGLTCVSTRAKLCVSCGVRPVTECVSTEHVCAGESPLEIHRGHAARVRTAVPHAGWHLVRTLTQTHNMNRSFIRIHYSYWRIWLQHCCVSRSSVVYKPWQQCIIRIITSLHST